MARQLFPKSLAAEVLKKSHRREMFKFLMKILLRSPRAELNQVATDCGVAAFAQFYCVVFAENRGRRKFSARR